MDLIYYANYENYYTHLAPSVVGIGSVSFTQLVQILLSLNYSTLVLCGVQELVGHFLGQVNFLLLFSRSFNEPLTCAIVRRLLGDWYGDLIFGTATSYRSHVQNWSTILDGQVKDFLRISLDLRFLLFGLGFVVFLKLDSLDVFEGFSHKFSGKLLFAIPHNVVRELGNSLVVENTRRLVVGGSFDGQMCHLSSVTRFIDCRLLVLLEHRLNEMLIVLRHRVREKNWRGAEIIIGN